ncbi:unnamed protein product [Darwinula stevensoni]|uniref:Tectonin beta-propeller repeat-containing protein 2 n=1 Tax=Darwinula stevensoni TaxID=69355 RepID=A0A7R8X7F8_9CRUS|nr:unnamed protein product [Darwinula stevensoni]CAG0889076.1 unnamed protein product [Darwinula stevensoni]
MSSASQDSKEGGDSGGPKQENCALKEWDMDFFLSHIPRKVQHALTTLDLEFTCVSSSSESIVIGTNVGLVYFYCILTGEFQRLRCAHSLSGTSCISLVESIDHMVAVGGVDGTLTIFQLSRPSPEGVEIPLQFKKAERFTIKGSHQCEVTALAWSANGERLISGDASGLVMHTRIDFARDIFQNKHPRVPLLEHPGTEEQLPIPKDIAFGPLKLFDSANLLVQCAKGFFIINPSTASLVTSCLLSHSHVKDVSSSSGVIYMIREKRMLTRIAVAPLPEMVLNDENSLDPMATMKEIGLKGLNKTRSLFDRFLPKVEDQVLRLRETLDEALRIPLVTQATPQENTPPVAAKISGKGSEPLEVIHHGKKGKRKKIGDKGSDSNSDTVSMSSRQSDDPALLILGSSSSSPNTTSSSVNAKPVINDDDGQSGTADGMGEPKLKLEQPDASSIEWKEHLLAKLIGLESLDSKETSQDTPSNTIQEVLEPLSGEKSLEFSPKTDSISTLLGRLESVISAGDEDATSLGSLSYGPPSDSSHFSWHTSGEDHVSLEQKECTEPSNEEIPTIMGDLSNDWLQYKSPGPLMSLAVCEHYLGCVDRKGTLYYSQWDGYLLRWFATDNPADQIAFSRLGDIIWRLHKGTAYALFNPSSDSLSGVRWIEAAQDVTYIAVGDSSAWYICRDGRIAVQADLSQTRPCSCEIVIEKDPCVSVVKLQIYGSVVWACDGVGRVFVRIGVSPRLPGGSEWALLDAVGLPGRIVALGLGPRDLAFVVDDKDRIFVKNGVGPLHQKGLDNRWWQVSINASVFPMSKNFHHSHKVHPSQLVSLLSSSYYLPIIAAGKKHVWFSQGNSPALFTPNKVIIGHVWDVVDVPLMSRTSRWSILDARSLYCDQGGIWLLSPAGQLLCLSPNLMQTKGISIPDNKVILGLSAAPESLWMLTIDGNVYVRLGITSSLIEGKIWLPLPLTQLKDVELKHLSVSSEVVWACDSRGKIYFCYGNAKSLNPGALLPAWICVEGKPPAPLNSRTTFTKVYVGPKLQLVWAIDNRHNVYAREGTFPEVPVGTEWVFVPGIQATQLAIGEKAVWALTLKGEVYRRYGITENNYVGDYWRRIPGTLNSISVSVDDRLWGIDTEGQLRMHLVMKLHLDEEECEQSTQVTQYLEEPPEGWELVS